MIDCLLIDSSKIEALLGITIDHELKCNDQVNNGKKQGKNLMHLPVFHLLCMFAKNELS